MSFLQQLKIVVSIGIVLVMSSGITGYQMVAVKLHTHPETVIVSVGTILFDYFILFKLYRANVQTYFR